MTDTAQRPILTTGMAVLAVIGLLAVAGCETRSASTTVAPLGGEVERVVILEPCEDRTGLQTSRDLAGEATAAMAKAIRESEVFRTGAGAPLRVSCDVEGFIEGSAVKRWVMPGWGATKGTLRAAVWRTGDGGDAMLGVFESRGQVSSGGLYTLGADDYILDVAARDIVRQMEAWARGG